MQLLCEGAREASSGNEPAGQVWAQATRKRTATITRVARPLPAITATKKKWMEGNGLAT